MTLFTRSKFLLPLFFILASFLLFSHSLHFDLFIFDDLTNIFLNPKIVSPGWGNLVWYWKNSLTPIIYNLWQLISLIFGTHSVIPYRLLNIIIHGLNSYLVYLLVLDFNNIFEINFKKNSAYLIALLFLAHPVVVESVVWISSLRILLTSLFALLFIRSYLKNNFNLNFLSILFFAITLLINPISGGVIFIIPVSSLILRRKMPTLEFLGLLLFLITFFTFHFDHTISAKYFSFVTMEDHLKLLILSLAKYIEICLFPFNISFNYQINPANLFKYDFRFLFTSIITIFGFFIGPLVFVKNKKFVLCLQLFFLSFIITNLGIYLHDFNNISIAANRYAYLALFPTLFLLVFIINKILEFFPRFITPVTYFLLLVFVVFTCKETMLWKSPEKLFSVSMEHTGESMEILTAKGVLLLKNNMYPDAESIFTKLLNKYPNSIEALSNLCELYSKTEDRKKIRIFLKDHSIEIEKLPVSSYLMIANLYILIEKSEIARSFINKYISTYGSNDFSQMLYNQSKPE